VYNDSIKGPRQAAQVHQWRQAARKGAYQSADAECCECSGALQGVPVLVGIDGGGHNGAHVGLHQERLGLQGVHREHSAASELRAGQGNSGWVKGT